MREDRIQSEAYQWFHNAYPNLRGLLAYNLNNSRNKIDGNKNLAMGLQKGRADFEFLWNRTVIFIEMKTDSGAQSPEQEKWQKMVEKWDYSYHVCRSVEEFKKLINDIIKYE